MRRSLLPLLAVFACSVHAQEITIDWQKARALHERASRGEKLTDEEQKYYDEAKRQRGQGAGQPQRPAVSPAVIESLVPLTDLAGTYQGQDGGLYGGGRSEPSPELAARAQKALAQVRPLAADGASAPSEKIVLMSIGMSNTTQEFSAFKRLADADVRKAESAVIVDGAQGARPAQTWATQEQPWEEARRRIAAAGVTPAQVQALWIKQANAGPSAGWPAETDRLRDDLRQIITKARGQFPNLRVVFLSSRIFAGYATSRLNPEPYAYESAFAVRAVIRDQPAGGPAILWGPYLWTNGAKGRAIDDLKWLPEDCGPDGTHPSASGQQKVARLLLDFFTKNPYAQPWFVRRP